MTLHMGSSREEARSVSQLQMAVASTSNLSAPHAPPQGLCLAGESQRLRAAEVAENPFALNDRELVGVGSIRAAGLGSRAYLQYKQCQCEHDQTARHPSVSTTKWALLLQPPEETGPLTTGR